MKIGHLDTKLPVTPVGTDRKATTATGPIQGQGAKAEETKVEISPEASALAAGDEGPFDAAKVELMSEALKNGTFKVNAGTIADKLIANAQELLARTYR
jgi:negative regulator of flagellin synthesis FlgM